jgi:hypothetical protein
MAIFPPKKKTKNENLRKKFPARWWPLQIGAGGTLVGY